MKPWAASRSGIPLHMEEFFYQKLAEVTNRPWELLHQVVMEASGYLFLGDYFNNFIIFFAKPSDFLTKWSAFVLNC